MSTIVNLGVATLVMAKVDLWSGVAETSRNDGPRIREYLKPWGLVPPQNWCAVSFCYWLREACERLNIAMPIKGSPAARGCEAQFIENRIWVPKARFGKSSVVPGNVPIWWRKSPGDWPGHIGIIEYVDWEKRLMHTVEGNSGPLGNRVARMERRMDDPQLLGVGVLSRDKPSSVVTDAELVHGRALSQLMGHLFELGEQVMEGEPLDPLAELWTEEE